LDSARAQEKLEAMYTQNASLLLCSVSQNHANALLVLLGVFVMSKTHHLKKTTTIKVDLSELLRLLNETKVEITLMTD